MALKAQLAGATALLLSMAIIVPAHAQDQPAKEPAATDANSGGIAEIVVTAQRRQESLQKVPVAITALTGEAMSERGINNIENVRYNVPNLTLGTQSGVPRLVIRGVGLEGTIIGQESPIAAHVNGVYLGRPMALLAAFFDVDRIEVLRGPQGTLYGRNTTGGAFNVTTRRPGDELNGYLTAHYGNYNDFKIEGAVGGPLNSEGTIAQRIAFTYNKHDGYGKNITTGDEVDNLKTYAIRSTTVLKPTDDLTLTVIADYDREKDHNGQYHYLGEGANTDEEGSPHIRPFDAVFGTMRFASKARDVAGNYDPIYRRKTWGVMGDIQYKIGDVELRSITAYRGSKWLIANNLGGGEFMSSLWAQGDKARQFSEDFQISGASDRFKWVVGAYYFREKFDGFQKVPINGLGFGLEDIYYDGYFAGGKITTNAYAIYGQGTYNVTDKLSVTLGGRYSKEKKSIVNQVEFTFGSEWNGQWTGDGVDPFTFNQSAKWNAFTPKFGIEYQIDPDTMIYASATKGFKSGAFNVGGVQDAVSPEKIWAYEAGFKTTQFDRRLKFNLAGFYYDVKDLQVSIIKAGGASNTLENAAALESYGMEAEITAIPVPELELTASVAWLHARYKDYLTEEEVHPAQGIQDLSGFTPAQSPNYSINLSAQYTLPTSFGSIALRGESYFVDDIYFNQFDRDIMREKAHSRHNAYLTARVGDHWRATAYVRNLTNERNVANAIQASIVAGHPVLGTYEAPRTYGMEVSYSF